MIDYKNIVNHLNQKDTDLIIKLFFYKDTEKEIKKNVLNIERINKLIDLNYKLYLEISENPPFGEYMVENDIYSGLYNDELEAAVNSFDSDIRLREEIHNFIYSNDYNFYGVTIDFEREIKELEKIDNYIIFKLRIYMMLVEWSDIKKLNKEEIFELIDRILKFYLIKKQEGLNLNLSELSFYIAIFSQECDRGIKEIQNIFQRENKLIDDILFG